MTNRKDDMGTEKQNPVSDSAYLVWWLRMERKLEAYAGANEDLFIPRLRVPGRRRYAKLDEWRRLREKASGPNTAPGADD